MMLVFDIKQILRLSVRYGVSSEHFPDTSCRGAFMQGDTLTFWVRVPRALCSDRANLRLYRDDDMSVTEMAAEYCGFDDLFDTYSVAVDAEGICADGESGLFYYSFHLETPYGSLYTARDGSLGTDPEGISCAQLTVYSSDMKIPEKFRGGMMYQIFVDRFFDGGRPVPPTKGKIRNSDWYCGIPQYAEKPGDELANNEFFGGNLWGVADKLDYIASLGVDTVYLCPIFEAASNHKYDTGDYEKIDAMFGGEEAFDHLVTQCKARGMRIILDGVFNHTGADSKYFNKYSTYETVGAYNSKESPYYGWYSFEDYPDRYRCWWGVKILPAVNGTAPGWKDYICNEDGIIRRYLKKGIDGWRLDVADELDDSFLDSLKAAARAENPEALIIGEVWEDASSKVAYDKRRRYFRGKQLDSVMNYPLKEAVIDCVLSRDCTGLCRTAVELWHNYPEDVSHVLMNFLGTHDTERILTVLSDRGTVKMTNKELSGFRLTAGERRVAMERLKLAWILLCAFPGMPCIYYGDEAGMEGGRDPFNRLPYAWGKEDKELVAFYRRIGEIRKAEPLFADGALRIIPTGNRSRFMLERQNGSKRLEAAVNLSDEPWEIQFAKAPRRLLQEGQCTKTVILEANSAEYFVL